MSPSHITDLKRLIEAMRFHLPAGFYMLFLPCLWGLMYTRHSISFAEIALFAAGALWAVSLGCLYNDWIDRDIDKQIARTQNRPFARPVLGHALFSPVMTIAVAILFIGPGLFFLKIFPWSANIVAFVALVGVLIYPFLKRWMNWPQLFLGLIYN
jgi:4-hydroxybenzoate polyprenyltransferase